MYLKKIIWLAFFCSLRLVPSQVKSSQTSFIMGITLSYHVIKQAEWIRSMLRNNSSLSFIITLHRSKKRYKRSRSKASTGKTTSNSARHSQTFIWESNTLQMEKHICVLVYADLFWTICSNDSQTKQVARPIHSLHKKNKCKNHNK